MLQHVRTIRLWRGEFTSKPPFDIGPDTLIVGYSLMGRVDLFPWCLAGNFPANVYDLHTAYLSVSNILLPYDATTKPARNRASVCRTRARPTAFRVGKVSTRKRYREDIGEGHWRKYGKPVVLRIQRGRRARLDAVVAQTIDGIRAVQADRSRAGDVLVSNYSAKTVARIQAARHADRSCRCGIWCRKTRPRS